MADFCHNSVHETLAVLWIQAYVCVFNPLWINFREWYKIGIQYRFIQSSLILKRLFNHWVFLAPCQVLVDRSVQFSHSVMSDSLRPHELQHTRPPCPSPTPGVYSNSCPLSRWCHPAISSSVVPFSSCPQSLPASESFPMYQLFAWGGQSTGVSALASVLPKNTQGWSPL